MLLKISLVIILIFFIAMFVWYQKKPYILINPQKSLIDEPIEITISNLSPREKVTIETFFKNNNYLWKASATFESDEQGLVNLATQAPLYGSYSGIDPMGLFWSMTPLDEKATRFFIDEKGLEIQLSVSYKNKVILTKQIHRLLELSNLEKDEIETRDITGTLIYSKVKQKLPGIIILHGSGSRIPAISYLLASHGFTVLGLKYFGGKSLQENLENIPLEYFQNAITWFKKLPQVQDNNIGLVGISRGGELALLIASMFPEEIKALVAYVPSNFIHGGFPYPNQPAWVYKNMAIRPFIGALSNDNEELHEAEDFLIASQTGLISHNLNTPENPYELSELFLARKDKYNALSESSSIKVENISCPLLILSGEEDKIWPSKLYGNLIMERLTKHNSKTERKHLSFPNAGHDFYVPNSPNVDQPCYHRIGKFWCLFGGTIEGNAYASRKSWAEVLKFFHEHLD